MGKAPTRDDVAKRAGVSAAVVSYVMNDGPKPVSDRARAKVLAAVEQLGYRPNKLARALRANRSSTIGLLMPDAANPFFWELAQRVEHECVSRGYTLSIGTTNNDETREVEYLQNLADRQVDGVIIISAASDWQHHAELAQVPTVLVDRAPAHAAPAVAQTDGREGSRLALEHLIEVHDRRRILVLAGPPELESTIGRRRGVEDALEAHQVVHGHLVNGAFSLVSGYSMTREQIASGEQFDAIFAFSDAQGIGALRACAEAGLNVPRDVSVAAFDGTDMAAYVRPSLTTVKQDVHAMARTAVASLEAMMRAGGAKPPPEAGPQRLERATLRIAESCGCNPDPTVFRDKS